MVSEVDTSRIPSALPKSAELLPLSVRVHLRSDPTGLVTVFFGTQDRYRHAFRWWILRFISTVRRHTIGKTRCLDVSVAR